jgi:uncharacterized protein YjbI with pentapeptide repeats
MDDATATRVDLSHADLTLASLGNANLRGANLCGADFNGAWLPGTNLTGARYDATTRWPAGFRPERRGAIRVSGRSSPERPAP